MCLFELPKKGKRNSPSHYPPIIHPNPPTIHPSSTQIHPNPPIIHPNPPTIHPSSTQIHPQSTHNPPKSTQIHPQGTMFHRNKPRNTGAVWRKFNASCWHPTRLSPLMEVSVSDTFLNSDQRYGNVWIFFLVFFFLNYKFIYSLLFRWISWNTCRIWLWITFVNK